MKITAEILLFEIFHRDKRCSVPFSTAFCLSISVEQMSSQEEVYYSSLEDDKGGTSSTTRKIPNLYFMLLTTFQATREVVATRTLILLRRFLANHTKF